MKQHSHAYGFLGVICGLVFVRLAPQALSSIWATFWADAVIIGLIVLWFVVLKRGIPNRYTQVLASIAFLLVGIACATLLSTLLDGRLALLGVLNVFRFAYYGLVVAFFLSALPRLDLHTSLVSKLLDWSFGINLFIVVIQLFDPPLLGDLVQHAFGADKLRSIWTGYPRVFGAFSNANWFGVYLLFYGSGWIALYLARVRRLRSLAARMLLLVLLLGGSGSRSAVVGVAIGASIMLLCGGRMNLIPGFALASMLFLTSIYQVAYDIPLMRRTIARFTDVLNVVVTRDGLFSVDALAARIGAWETAWKAFIEQPLYGFGDNSLGIGLIPHNSYLTLLLDFGLIGAIPLLAWSVCCVRAITVSGKQTIASKVMRLWLIGFSAGFAVVSFTADFIHSTQVMLLWLLVLSAAIVANRPKGNLQGGGGERS